MNKTMLLAVALLATTLSFAQTPTISKSETPSIDEFQGLINATKVNDLKKFTAEWEMLAKKYTSVLITFKETVISAGLVNPACSNRCDFVYQMCLIMTPDPRCLMDYIGCIMGCAAIPQEVTLSKTVQPVKPVINDKK